METFSALLALCAGNLQVTGVLPSQRPVTRGFDVFFDLRLNKRLSKQSRRRWFETPLHSLWRYCKAIVFHWLVFRDGILKMPGLRLMPRDLNDEKSTFIQVMARRCPASINYLKQCWPSNMTPYGVIGQWVNGLINPLGNLEISQIFKLTLLEYSGTSELIPGLLMPWRLASWFFSITHSFSDGYQFMHHCSIPWDLSDGINIDEWHASYLRWRFLWCLMASAMMPRWH